MHFSNSSSRGMSLAEVLIAVAILGVFAMMCVGAVRFINNLGRQRAVLETQRDAQIVLYQIAKDIRNSDYIDVSTVAPYSLLLRSYDYTNGYDIRAIPSLFAEVNRSTITYIYRTDEGGYLERTIVNASKTQTKKLLKNILKPDPGANLLFRPLSAARPYTAVDIVLRLAPAFFKDTPRSIQTQAAIRTRTGN